MGCIVLLRIICLLSGPLGPVRLRIDLLDLPDPFHYSDIPEVTPKAVLLGRAR